MASVEYFVKVVPTVFDNPLRRNGFNFEYDIDNIYIFILDFTYYNG